MRTKAIILFPSKCPPTDEAASLAFTDDESECMAVVQSNHKIRLDGGEVYIYVGVASRRITMNRR